MKTFWALSFSWLFVCGLTFHYSWAKSPVQSREIASQHKFVHPWYDASFKI